MSKCVPARIVLALLCATGVIELYITRTNLSLAIVEMIQIVNSETNSDVTQKEPYCYRGRNETSTSILNGTYIEEDEEDGDSPIKLTTTQRGYILSSFFYAYGLTAILGGRLAEKYGTKKLFGIAVFVDALGNIIIPVATKFNYILIILIRSLMGAFQGACYPALHCLLTHWIPTQEFSRFIAFVYTANNFGSIIALNFSGFIMSKYGWELVFYISGAVGFLWIIFWTSLMYESPEAHPRITEEEKLFIMNNRAKSDSNTKPKKIPWLNFLTSFPLWIINIAHAGNMFGLIFLVTQLPLYMSSIVGVNIKANGFLSSLPFIAMYIGSNGFSWLTSFLMKKVNWSKKTWHRVCVVIGHHCTALLILLVGYVGCNTASIMILFSSAMILNGISTSGYILNHLQITPNFAGTALGFSNTVAFLYTTLCPILVGALTPEETLQEWIFVYWYIFGNFLITGTIFFVFLSADVQPWDNTNKENLKTNKEDASVLENLKIED